MKSKWVWTLLVAALGPAVYARNVLATPSSGVTTTILARSVFHQFELNGHSVPPGTWEARMVTRGLTDAYVVDNKLAPGGTTGWHSHPGPSLILVVAGAVTNYDSSVPGCAPGPTRQERGSSTRAVTTSTCCVITATRRPRRSPCSSSPRMPCGRLANPSLPAAAKHPRRSWRGRQERRTGHRTRTCPRPRAAAPVAAARTKAAHHRAAKPDHSIRGCRSPFRAFKQQSFSTLKRHATRRYLSLVVRKAPAKRTAVQSQQRRSWRRECRVDRPPTAPRFAQIREQLDSTRRSSCGSDSAGSVAQLQWRVSALSGGAPVALSRRAMYPTAQALVGAVVATPES